MDSYLVSNTQKCRFVFYFVVKCFFSFYPPQQSYAAHSANSIGCYKSIRKKLQLYSRKRKNPLLNFYSNLLHQKTCIGTGIRTWLYLIIKF